MRHTLLLLIVFWYSCLFAQDKATLSGTISDAGTGELVFQARISIVSLSKGTFSNEYGFYSLTVPKGQYEIQVTSFGKKTIKQTIDLTDNRVLNFELPDDDTEELEVVEINARKGENINSTQLGQIELDIEKIKTLPAFLGEVDIIKTLQLLPGVSSANEGGQGFYVRGGSPDQNLVLLDEAQVYNASHLFGFFSVFNADAVKSVNLIKGGMPANYGGRISSVMEVKMNEGNNRKFVVKGGIGLISSRLTVEGPLKKEKGSFMIAGRRTYIDVLMKPFLKRSSNFAGTGYYFFDLNFKANYTINKNNRIYLSAYYGKDEFSFGNKADDFMVKMPWGNGVASVRWNHIFNSKLFLNLSGTFTDYRFSFNSEMDKFNIGLSTGIRDYGAKADFSYFPGSRHRIKFGVDYIYHTFTPVSVSAEQDESIDFNTGMRQSLRNHESAVYIQDEIDITDRIRINAGLRYSMYQFTGPFIRYIKGPVNGNDSSVQYGKNELIQFYQGLEPRISGRILLDKKSSVKAGFSYNNQYIHLASLSSVSLPTDIWYPSTEKIKPQRGWQASAGYFRDLFNDKFELSVEIYYKKMKNLVEFSPGATPIDNVNDNTDNLLIMGEGWGYGAEFFLQKKVGKFTGWIGYTWAKSERKFPEIQEKAFPSKYDRRHDLTLVGTYKLNERWTFSACFVYASGNTLTLPSSYYVQDQNVLYNYGERNSTRMAPYHRLDLSATWYDKPEKLKKDPQSGETIRIKKRFRQNVNISVYNVYNRANPYFLYISTKGSLMKDSFKMSVKQASLFPVLPSVTWNFQF